MADDVTLRRLTPGERDAFWNYTRDWAGKRGTPLASPDRPELVSGFIALRGNGLAGFLLYVVQAGEMALTLVTIGVVSELRRRGVGSALLAALVRDMQAAAPTRIDALIGERDLHAQLFLRANAFRAVRILPAAFANGADDGYYFERVVPRLSAHTSSTRRSKRAAE